MKPDRSLPEAASPDPQRAGSDTHPDVRSIPSPRPVRVAWRRWWLPLTVLLALVAAGHFVLRRAQEKAEAQRRSLLEQHGSRAMAQGDLFGALLWFAEALATGLPTPEEDTLLRLRVAAALRRAPLLERLFVSTQSRLAVLTDEDGRWALFVRNPDGPRTELEVRDTVTGRALSPKCVLTGPLQMGAFSGDGLHFVTVVRDPGLRLEAGAGGGPCRVQVWETGTGMSTGPPIDIPGRVWHVALDRAGERLLAVISGAGVSAGATADEVRVWDVVQGRPITSSLRLVGAAAEVLVFAAFSPDNSRVVICGGAWDGSEGAAQVWDLGTLCPATPPLAHAGLVVHAAFSADGRRLATASVVDPFGLFPIDRTGEVGFWGAEDGRALAPVLGVEGPAVQVVFSPAGTECAVTSWPESEGGSRLCFVDVVECDHFLPARRSLETRPAVGRFAADGRNVLLGGAPWNAWLFAPGEPAGPTRRSGLGFWDWREDRAVWAPMAWCQQPGTGVIAPDLRHAITYNGVDRVAIWNWSGALETGVTARDGSLRLEPDPRPVGRLVALAKLLSGRQVSSEGLIPLPPADLERLWQDNRASAGATADP